MNKSLISIQLKSSYLHYIIQLLLISILLLLFKFYFEEDKFYQKYKISINETIINNFHRSVGDNLEYSEYSSEYLYDLILPLPQQKYNNERADYLKLLKDYFLFLKYEVNDDNFNKLSIYNKEIYNKSEFNLIQLVLSSYKKDFINVTSKDNVFKEEDLQDFLDNTSEIYKEDILKRQLEEFNKIDEQITNEINNNDIKKFQDFSFNNLSPLNLSDNDLETISIIFDIETYKLKILLYENSLKNKNFIDYFDNYFFNANLFKIEDLVITTLGPNKKILVITILLLISLALYLEVRKWKKKKTTLI